MSPGVEQKREDSPIQECIAEALRKGCVAKYQNGGFLGKGWFEVTGDGVETIKKLVSDYGDEGIRQFSDRFSPIFRTQLERKKCEAKTWYDNFLRWYQRDPNSYAQGMRDNSLNLDTIKREGKIKVFYEALLESFDNGKAIDVTVPLDDPAEINVSGYSGRFAPNGIIIPLQKPQPQETQS